MACGIIQTKGKAERLVSVQANMNGENLYGQIKLFQRGHGDFVHVTGSVMGLESAGAYQISIAPKSHRPILGAKGIYDSFPLIIYPLLESYWSL